MCLSLYSSVFPPLFCRDMLPRGLPVCSVYIYISIYLLLRVDAVDGANHSLCELLLKPPPLRFGPVIEGHADTSQPFQPHVREGRKARGSPSSPFSSLEVVLPHRHVLKHTNRAVQMTGVRCCVSAAACVGIPLTVVLILPLSVVMLSRWWRLAKGLAAPQDSR